MTWTLVRKILRDLRWPLLVVGLLLMLFEFLWAKIVERICVQVLPDLTKFMGLADIMRTIFQDTGKVMQTMMGGEGIRIDRAADMLSVGYVHPLVLTILAVWAIGRSAGAIVGEVDRGTMELLLAQPVPRSRVVLAHLIVDLVTIPVLCLCLWAGTWLGTWSFGLLKVGASLDSVRHVDPWAVAPSLVNAAALIFAMTGTTLWLSSLGRFRSRVLGAAVLITLVQYLINVIGQMLESMKFLRPLTIFCYYRPQQIILHNDWRLELGEMWNSGQPLAWVYPVAVLFTVGAIGYGLAFWTFGRRDLPAPL
jgi:ABC-2 type transport system permease protein